MIDGRINFLVRQSEARGRTSPAQSFEEFLWQSIVLASESFAGIERAEQIQATASDGHQLFDGQIPAGD